MSGLLPVRFFWSPKPVYWVGSLLALLMATHLGEGRARRVYNNLIFKDQGKHGWRFFEEYFLVFKILHISGRFDQIVELSGQDGRVFYLYKDTSTNKISYSFDRTDWHDL